MTRHTSCLYLVVTAADFDDRTAWPAIPEQPATTSFNNAASHCEMPRVYRLWGVPHMFPRLCPSGLDDVPHMFKTCLASDPVLSAFVNVKTFLWHACSALCFLNFCFGCVFVSSCLCASVCSTVCLAAFVLAVRFLSAMCFSAFVSPVCFSLLFRQCVCQLVCASYSQ